MGNNVTQLVSSNNLCYTEFFVIKGYLYRVYTVVTKLNDHICNCDLNLLCVIKFWSEEADRNTTPTDYCKRKADEYLLNV